MEGYAAAQFDLVRGKVEAAQEAVEAWRGSSWAPRDTAQALRLASYLSLLLDAQLAARLRRFDALARLEQLDSVLVQGPTYGGWLTDGSTFGGFEPVGNLIAARLWHERGAPARALATARRRAVGVEPRAVYLSLILDEARYAALVGNASAAIQAYQQYLTVRAAPEPTLRAAVQEVQAELDALRLAAERLGE